MEKEVETKVTPKECVTALDLADEVINLGADSLKLSEAGIMAYLDDDVDSINASSAGIEENTQKIEELTPGYHDARSACKAETK